MIKKILKKMNSISIKVIIIYITLAVMNISFFTSIVWENQVDLIYENSKLNAEDIITSILQSLKKFESSNKESIIFKTTTTKEILSFIDSIVKPLVKDYAIFSEKGEIIEQTNKKLKLPKTYIRDGMTSKTNLDFTGKEYYINIDEKSYVMYFYIPLTEFKLNSYILFIPYNIKNLNKNLQNLYSQVIIVFIFTALFHIIFAFLLFRVIIKPVKLLMAGSKKITNGKLDTRVELKRKDEIGQLADVFNVMAQSIQEKVETLNATTEEMEVINEYVYETNKDLDETNKNLEKANKELEEAKRIADRDMEMAINVQTTFFIQDAPQTDKWDTAFKYIPASGVSGDLYDFYVEDNKLQGVSLFDVSGHGISSGLITMLAKAIIARNIHEIEKNIPLDRVLATINEELISEIDNVDNYLTGIILRFADDIVEYVNAGHTDLLFRNNIDNSVKIIGSKNLDFRGTILGIGILSKNFESIKFKAEKNDSLLLFSDCYVDAANKQGKRYEIERIIQTFQNCPNNASAKEMLDFLMNDFNQFVSDSKLPDDLTILLLKKKN